MVNPPGKQTTRRAEVTQKDYEVVPNKEHWGLSRRSKAVQRSTEWKEKRPQKVCNEKPERIWLAEGDRHCSRGSIKRCLAPCRPSEPLRYPVKEIIREEASVWIKWVACVDLYSNLQDACKGMLDKLLELMIICENFTYFKSAFFIAVSSNLFSINKKPSLITPS